MLMLMLYTQKTRRGATPIGGKAVAPPCSSLQPLLTLVSARASCFHQAPAMKLPLALFSLFLLTALLPPPLRAAKPPFSATEKLTPFIEHLDAMLSSRHSHSFLGISGEGQVSVIRTSGHPTTHLVLRGGRKGANYDPATLLEALSKMDKMSLHPRLLVDCSHANSNKQATAQGAVWDEILAFHLESDSRVIGGMIESVLETGRQDLLPNQPLKPGLSITDPCLGWSETEELIRSAAGKLRRR